MAPMPSVGWADAGAQGAPLEVAEQPVIVAIPRPTMGQMGLPTTLVALTMAGVMPADGCRLA